MSMQAPPGWEYVAVQDSGVMERLHEFRLWFPEHSPALRGFFFGPGNDSTAIYAVMDAAICAADMAYSVADLISTWRPAEVDVHDVSWADGFILIRCYWP